MAKNSGSGAVMYDILKSCETYVRRLDGAGAKQALVVLDEEGKDFSK
jgi:hypothetical protein